MKVRMIIFLSAIGALVIIIAIQATPLKDYFPLKKDIQARLPQSSDVRSITPIDRTAQLEEQIAILNEKVSIALDKIRLLELSITETGNTKDNPSFRDENLAKQLEEAEKRLRALQQRPSDSTSVPTAKTREEQLTDAVARVTPAVVSIVISKDVPQLEVVYINPFGNDPFFRDFNVRVPRYRQKGVERQKVGAGTGFILTSDGTIVTNKHVVLDEEASYTVLLSDGSQKEAKVLYRDPYYDIALIDIEGKGFAKVSLGDSEVLKLGQTVMAIGNALGEYNNSVSQGIISGLNRSLQAGGQGFTEQLNGVIQTDAAINPGNSGGPLLDLDGLVIGVNVATVQGSNSISFSIPINRVKEIVTNYFGKKIF